MKVLIIRPITVIEKFAKYTSVICVILRLNQRKIDQAQESASVKHQTLLVLYIYHPRQFKSKEAYVKYTQ